MPEINYVEFKTEPYILPAVVVIISIVILIHYFYTRIYGKKHVNNTDKHYSDIRSWYYGTYANPLDVQHLVQTETDSILAQIDASLNELEDIMDVLLQEETTVSQLIKDTLKAQIIQHAQNVNITNEQIIQTNDLIMKVSDLQVENATSLDNIKEVYIQKMHKYLDDLIHSLSVIQYQYNISSVTSSMNGAMGQLSNLYNAIRGTIVKYIDNGFIPTYIDGELDDADKIPELETRRTFDRNAIQGNFGSIGRSFQQYGYT